MHVEVYADIIFFINFIMDFLILWIVSKLIKEKVSIFKLILGSFFLSLSYCLVIFIPILKSFYNIYMSFIILCIGILIAFGFKNPTKFIKLIFYTHLSAFMIGGICIGLFYYSNITNIIGNIIGFSINYFSLKILLVSIASSYIILKLYINYIRKILHYKKSFYNVNIFLNENNVSIKALVDTGNSLVDPLTNTPVMIVEFKSIKKILPYRMQILFYENKRDDIYKIIDSISDCLTKNKLRIIPFKSIGKENGILLGFKSDKIEIKKEDTVLELKDIVVGIYNNKFSNRNDFQGLLNSVMIEK